MTDKRRKVSLDDYKDIKRIYADGRHTYKQLAELYGISDKQIYCIIKDRTGNKPRNMNKVCKISSFDVNAIRMLYAEGNCTYTDLSRMFGISKPQIHRIIRNKTVVDKDDSYKHTNNLCKITREIAENIRSLYSTGLYTQQALGDMFNMHYSNVSLIVRYKRWVNDINKA
jgi:DNA invertase Pin-like site-specific DNA recombinase